MSNPNPAVEFYFVKAKKWLEELKNAREILLACGLTEELKWGVPCYTFQQRNILLLHVFADYCAVLFVKGALLRDPYKVLIQQTRNTQAARQIRFTSVPEILNLETTLREYIREAVEIEQKGLKVAYQATQALDFPEELQEKLAENSGVRSAFQALTPGRQRAYVLYFSAPKQSKTRTARIEKYVQHILNGRGLHD